MKKELRRRLNGISANGGCGGIPGHDDGRREEILDSLMTEFLKEWKAVEGRGVIQEKIELANDVSVHEKVAGPPEFVDMLLDSRISGTSNEQDEVTESGS